MSGPANDLSQTGMISGAERRPAVDMSIRLADHLMVKGDGTPQGTRVYLDGRQVTGVTGVEWDVGVGQVTTLTLKLAGGFGKGPTIDIAPDTPDT